MFSRMMRCVLSLVYVTQQGIDGLSMRSVEKEKGRGEGRAAAAPCARGQERLPQAARRGAGLQPADGEARGGGGSCPGPAPPALPADRPGALHSPMKSRASMNVPVVSTTAPRGDAVAALGEHAGDRARPRPRAGRPPCPGRGRAPTALRANAGPGPRTTPCPPGRAAPARRARGWRSASGTGSSKRR